MTDQHPITPTPELVQCFLRSNPVTPTGMTYEQFIATRFAQWGADQELEACCEWVTKDWTDIEIADMLRSARRPKPPSLKEQALEALKDIEREYVIGVTTSTIRRALEALSNG